MRILYLGTDVEGLGIPFQLQREDNQVSVFAPGILSGDGILTKTDSWRENLVETDLIVLSPGFARYEEVFRKFGKPFVGGSQFETMVNSTKQKDFAEQCGLRFCSNFEHKVYIAGFFNGRSFAEPLMCLVLNCRLLQGGLGPQCGATGITLKSVSQKPDFVSAAEKGLRKLGIRDLVVMGFKDEDITGLSCGLLPELLYCITEGMRSDLTDVLFGVAQGTLKEFDLSDDWVIGVKLTVPPFPYINPVSNYDQGKKVYGLTEENLKHIFLCGVYKRGKDYFVDNSRGDILFATARGRTLREAQKRAYRTLSNIEVSDKQYRIDVGATAIEAHKEEFVRSCINGLQ